MVSAVQQVGKLMTMKFATRMYESWLYNLITSAELSISSWSSFFWFLNRFYFSLFRFHSFYTNLRYGQTSEIAAGQMWFTLTLFWHSLILIHQIILYRVVL